MKANKKNSLRLVMLSGDWIPLNLPKKITKKFANAQTISLGGATEASIWSIYYPVTKVEHHWKSIPYGMPLANQKFYVLNAQMNLCPVGVQGEFYIGGAGVARGYLNDQEKTENSFINHPKLGYIYKTGDYGVLTRNGYIEFLGRRDQQVKIKGYRVELGEIERWLLRHSSIKNVIVIDRTDASGRKYLCAYIVSDEKPPVSELRDFLSVKLPDYMVPAHFVYIEKIPLTPNGKVNRKELPELEVEVITGNEYQAPESYTEKKLASVWELLLNIRKVGSTDNFFELGGDSLTATRLAASIRKEFSAEIPLNEIFKSPTIRDIAKYIIKADKLRGVKSVENMVLLKRGTEAGKNIFFIHAGSGEVEVYVDLCNGLKENFSCWAIRAERHGYGPRNNDITELATLYLAKIRQIQPHGPYDVVGWCVGGTVAFEIARQLEEEAEKIEFLALINSLAPQEGLLGNEEEFSLGREYDVIENFTSEGLISKLKAHPIDNLKDLWDKVVDYIESEDIGVDVLRAAVPADLARLIPNFDQLGRKELIYYVNAFRTSQLARGSYLPPNTINSQVYFFEANGEAVANKDRWNDYCDKPVKAHQINGDHVSIMRNPNIEEVAKLFNLNI